MKYIILPIVYVFTLGLFPLFLYWYPYLYVNCMFDKVAETTFARIVNIIQDKKQKIHEERIVQRR